MLLNQGPSLYFLVCKGLLLLSNDDVGVWQGASYFGRYGRELVSKIGDFVKKRKVGGGAIVIVERPLPRSAVSSIRELEIPLPKN